MVTHMTLFDTGTCSGLFTWLVSKSVSDSRMAERELQSVEESDESTSTGVKTAFGIMYDTML